MSWSKTSLFTFLVYLVFFAASCGSNLVTIRHYTGPQLSDQKIARVVIPRPGQLQKVDGQEIRTLGRRFTVLDLEPGQHRVTTIYKEIQHGFNTTVTKWSNPIAFEFNAEPGKLYFVITEVSGNSSRQFLSGPFPMDVTIPDTGRRVYLGRALGSGPDDVTDNLCIMVEDQGQQTAYEGFLVREQILVFSEDEQHIAFFVYHGRADFQWIVDGVPQPVRFQALLGKLKYSKDGSRFAYMARTGNTTNLIVDGRTTVLTDKEVSIGDLAFSSDSRHMAYRARLPNDTELIISDGKEIGPFQEAFSPYFSPKKSDLFFFARRNDKWRMYFNDKQSPLEFADKPLPIVVFDAEENRFAYVARFGERLAVVLDGHVGPQFDHVSFPEFSPDNVHLAYAGATVDAFTGEKTTAIIVDQKNLGTFGEVDLDSIGYSEDSKTLFFKVRKDDSWVMKELDISPQEPEPATPQPAIPEDATPGAA